MANVIIGFFECCTVYTSNAHRRECCNRSECSLVIIMQKMLLSIFFFSLLLLRLGMQEEPLLDKIG